MHGYTFNLSEEASPKAELISFTYTMSVAMFRWLRISNINLIFAVTFSKYLILSWDKKSKEQFVCITSHVNSILLSKAWIWGILQVGKKKKEVFIGNRSAFNSCWIAWIYMWPLRDYPVFLYSYPGDPPTLLHHYFSKGGHKTKK